MELVVAIDEVERIDEGVKAKLVIVQGMSNVLEGQSDVVAAAETGMLVAGWNRLSSRRSSSIFGVGKFWTK